MELRRKQPAAAADALARARVLKPKDRHHRRRLLQRACQERPQGQSGAGRMPGPRSPSSQATRWLAMSWARSWWPTAIVPRPRVEIDKFAGLSGVKPEAKAKAQEILKTCTPAKSGKKKTSLE